jgi:hypothetical protein
MLGEVKDGLSEKAMEGGHHDGADTMQYIIRAVHKLSCSPNVALLGGEINAYRAMFRLKVSYIAQR